MATSPNDDAVIDASVLINFLRIDRMDLVGAHPFVFCVTDTVSSEVTDLFPDQQTILTTAVSSGYVEETRADSIEELVIFEHFESEGALGRGECSCIAVAAHRGYWLAIDDRTARNAALRSYPALNTTCTRDIMVDLIESSVLSVAEADSIKNDWETNHSFVLPFSSFEAPN